MLLLGQERSTENAALAVESRCDPIVLVATKANSSRVSGSYNRHAGGGPCCYLPILKYTVFEAVAVDFPNEAPTCDRMWQSIGPSSRDWLLAEGIRPVKTGLP